MKKFVSLLAVLFLLSACSGSGTPSDSQIEKAIITFLINADKSNRGLVAKNFHKIHAFVKDGKYIADVEFDVSGGPRNRWEAELIKTEKGWVVYNLGRKF